MCNSNSVGCPELDEEVVGKALLERKLVEMQTQLILTVAYHRIGKIRPYQRQFMESLESQKTEAANNGISLQAASFRDCRQAFEQAAAAIRACAEKLAPLAALELNASVFPKKERTSAQWKRERFGRRPL